MKAIDELTASEFEDLINDNVENICKILNIDIPNIVPTNTPINGDPNKNGLYLRESDTIIIKTPTIDNRIDYIKTLAHELRHKYQFMHNKKLIIRTKIKLFTLNTLNVDIKKSAIYTALPNEVDCEAFAWKYMQDHCNYPYYSPRWKGFKRVYKLINKRMNKLNKIYSQFQ